MYVCTYLDMSTNICFAFLSTSKNKQTHKHPRKNLNTNACISVSPYSYITINHPKASKSHWKRVTSTAFGTRPFYLYLCDTGYDTCRVSQARGKVSQESLARMDWQNEPQQGTSHTNDRDPNKDKKQSENLTALEYNSTIFTSTISLQLQLNTKKNQTKHTEFREIQFFAEDLRHFKPLILPGYPGVLLSSLAAFFPGDFTAATWNELHAKNTVAGQVPTFKENPDSLTNVAISTTWIGAWQEDIKITITKPLS